MTVKRKHYLNAFERMLQARRERERPIIWETPEEVMDWWLGNKKRPVDSDQVNIADLMED